MADKITTVLSYAIAILILGAVVYYLPEAFIGFLVGYGLGSNKDKIQAWVDKKED